MCRKGHPPRQDNVALFTTRFGVPVHHVPQRVYPALHGRRAGSTTRHFIHKLPISLTGEAPVVSFAFLVTDTTGQGLSQFLHDHIQLLNHLPDWRIVAVAPRHIPGIPACETAFRRFVVGAQQPRSQEEMDALRTYFVTLDRVERDEIAGITMDDIRRFHDARRRSWSHARVEVRRSKTPAGWRDPSLNEACVRALRELWLRANALGSRAPITSCFRGMGATRRSARRDR